MKFNASNTFFIRNGWLSKGMRHVAQDEEVFISKKENPMDVLGIGANMVKSLRYWMTAVGLTKEETKGRRSQSFTKLGERIFHYDEFIEELGTLQLLHYRLASNVNLATAWYYFFNEFNMNEFDRENFIHGIENFIVMSADPNNVQSVSPHSLDEDFTCIINTYTLKKKNNIHPEDNIYCPFERLGLIDILDSGKNKIYRKSTPSPDSFNPWVILAIIVEQAQGEKTIPLNNLLTQKCNIGRTFNLDTISMMAILHNVEKTGGIKIIRTAGLDVIQILGDKSFEDCVDQYYTDIKGGVENE